MKQKCHPPDQIKWQEIKNGFAKRWNFPNCCGAIDGKHVVIKIQLEVVVSTTTTKVVFHSI